MVKTLRVVSGRSEHKEEGLCECNNTLGEVARDVVLQRQSVNVSE